MRNCDDQAGRRSRLVSVNLRPFPNGGGWIGVDLDGTLAHYDGWVSPSHIGEPIPLMLERVRRWVQSGKKVAIVTARVSEPSQREECVAAIRLWCLKHVGEILPITHAKDYGNVRALGRSSGAGDSQHR